MRRVTLVLILVLTACRRESGPPHFPNAPVIVISIDTLRADHLPIYGYKAVETPAIDALAHDAVVFDYAISHCPLTLPSHVSLLTGLVPSTNGVRNNLGFRYDSRKFPSLPQTLKQKGYETGGAVSSYVLRGETGLRDAFDFYDDAVEQRPGVTSSEYQRSGEATRVALSRWLDTVGRKPFFALFHLYEPHAPYTPPEPFRSKYTDAYDGEIAAADDIVGRFLAELKQRGIYDRAVIVLLSDHGEGLGDHGEQQHGALLYTEEIRVPLLIKLPKNTRGGTRIGGHAALVDIVPTVEAIVGATKTKTEGIDLFAGPLPARDIYSETIYPYLQLGWSDMRSMMTDKLHYIHATRPEMYDIARDPAEKNDVLKDNRREAARLRDLIAKFPPPTAGNATIDPETAAKLSALGYVGSVKTRSDNGPLPNPRDEIGIIDETRDAFRLADEGNVAAAMPKLQSIVARNPRLVDVWIRIAEVNLDTGHMNEAIDAYKQAIAAAGPLSSEIVADLGFVYLQTGKLDDAEKSAELAMAGSPDKARALMVRVAGTRGNLERAETIAHELADRPNASASDVLLLAEVVLARGHADDALRIINRAASIAGPHGVYGLELMRGEALEKLQRPEDAVAAYEAEIQRFPRNMEARRRIERLGAVRGR